MVVLPEFATPQSSPELNRFVIVFVSLVSLFATLMNILVIYVYARGSGRKKKLFVVNLAVAEFLCPVTSYWMMVTSAINDRWLYGSIGCQYYAFTTGLFGMASVGSLVAMAVERYTVCHYFADKHMRIRTKYCTICGIWLYAAAMTVPPLLGWGRYGPDLYKSSCSFDYFSNDVNRQSFMIYLLFFGFFVPGWIIIACYAGIFKQIVRNEQTMQLLLLRPRKSSKRRLDAPHSSVIQKSRSSDPMLINESDVHYQLRPVVSLTEMGKFDPVKTHKYVRSFPSDHWDFVCRLMARREVQFARLTILIVSAFFLCWTPYTIVTIFCQLGVKSFFSPTASVITVVFAKSSVALNPLIYALKEKRFRSSVKRLVNRLLRRRCK